MAITLIKAFAPNTSVDAWDVRQIKKSLNRLGYYQPLEQTGITGIPDQGVFSALKQFQSDHGIRATGTAKPGDETIERLNEQVAEPRAGFYLWRTVEDDKVRQAHAAYNYTVRDWSDAPDPGEDFNCRCWAEPVKDIIVPQNASQEVKDAFEEIKQNLRKFDYNKYYLSARLLRHYVKKSGKPVILSSNAMDSSTTIKDAIAVNQERFIDSLTKSVVDGRFPSLRDRLLNLKDTESVELNDYWDVDRNKIRVFLEGDSDFFRAIGSVKIRSRAVIQVKRKGSMIAVKGQIIHGFDDTYDFDGQDDIVNEELFGKQRLLAATAYAKVFPVHWEKNKKLKGKIFLDDTGAIKDSRFQWMEMDR